MNKHLLIAAVALMGGSLAAGAQMQVVKDAEKAMKDGKTPAEVLTVVTPAFSDPETQELAQTYYVPGKAFFNEAKDLWGRNTIGRLDEKGKIQMYNDLLDGYDYFMKALPLDSVPDNKGKIKTKYSKDIVGVVTSYVNDYYNAALDFSDKQQHDKAYKALDIYLNIYDNEPFKSKVPAQPDSIIGEIYFYLGTAAWQDNNRYDDALKAFAASEQKGYNKKKLYDYAVAVAANAKNDNAVIEWATKGKDLYGNEDPNFVGNIINVYLHNKDFDKAFSIIDEAIANDPNNAQYYMVKGILYDNQDNAPMAKEMFYKALTIDPNNTGALTQYGIALCNEAYKLGDQAPTTVAESQAYFDSKIKPLFIEAAEYLEKAWQLDNNNSDALNYLDNIYYNLRDEAKQQEIQERRLK